MVYSIDLLSIFPYRLAHLCSTCGKGFKTMGTLRSHTIRHSENKPVACSKCPRRFFSKADLRKHMDVHTDRKYVCCLCGSVLSSKRSLDEHTSKFSLYNGTCLLLEFYLHVLVLFPLQGIDIEKQRSKLVIYVSWNFELSTTLSDTSLRTPAKNVRALTSNRSIFLKNNLFSPLHFQQPTNVCIANAHLPSRVTSINISDRTSERKPILVSCVISHFDCKSNYENIHMNISKIKIQRRPKFHRIKCFFLYCI